jgi:hypothetical protein
MSGARVWERGYLKIRCCERGNAAEIAGLRAVVVQAKDDNAKAFYEHFGFISAPTNPYRLFLSLTDVKSNLAATER